jgi:bacterioferritin
MQGKQAVIDALNAGLTIELTSVNQYFVQSKMCRNWGLHKLADRLLAESTSEMKHADKLIDRIIFLEGVPEIARYDIIRVGGNVEKQFSNDLSLETKGIQTYNNAVQICLDSQDAGSRVLVESLLIESEKQVDWLESQIDLMNKVGIQNYLAQQIGEPPRA